MELLRGFFRNKIMWLVIVAVLAGVFGVSAYRRSQTAAVVNGYRIPRAVIDGQLAAVKAKEPGRFSGAEGAKEEARVRRMLINELVTTKLLGQAAANAGIKVSETEIDAKERQIQGIFASRGKFMDSLTSQGWTLESFRDNLRDQLAAVHMQESFGKKAKPAGQEITQYVQENQASLANVTAEQAQARAREQLLEARRAGMYEAWVKSTKASAQIVIY